MIQSCSLLSIAYHSTSIHLYVNFNEKIIASIDFYSLVFWNLTNMNFSKIKDIGLSFTCSPASWVPEDLFHCVKKSTNQSRIYSPFGLNNIKTIDLSYYSSTMVYYPFALGIGSTFIFAFNYRIYGFNR
jgi:hypothetical protein